MKKLSLDALKSKASSLVSADVMDKITGGNKAECHCTWDPNVPQGQMPIKCGVDDGQG